MSIEEFDLMVPEPPAKTYSNKEIIDRLRFWYPIVTPIGASQWMERAANRLERYEESLRGTENHP